LEIAFVQTTSAMTPVFLRPFTNALMIYLLGHRYWKTVCCAAACEGNDQWQLQWILHTWHFSFSPTRKDTSNKHSILPLTFLKSVLVPPGP